MLGSVSGNSCMVYAFTDTGFNAYLTLSLENIASLVLVTAMSQPFKLVDGSIVNMTFFKAELELHGKRKPIVVQMTAFHGSPLLRMRAMKGNHLTVSVNEDGVLLIEEA